MREGWWCVGGEGGGGAERGRGGGRQGRGAPASIEFLCMTAGRCVVAMHWGHTVTCIGGKQWQALGAHSFVHWGTQ